MGNNKSKKGNKALAEQNREEIQLEELIISQVYTVQALIQVLEEKGLITREEILQAFKDIQESMGGCDCDCGGGHKHNH